MKVVTIHIHVEDARELRRIEARIRKLGHIIAESYLRAPDKNGIWQIRSASYVVLTEDPRRLKIAMRQIDHHSKAHLLIGS